MKTLKEQIYSIIQDALVVNKFDVCKTARQLKIGKSSIYRYIEQGHVIAGVKTLPGNV